MRIYITIALLLFTFSSCAQDKKATSDTQTLTWGGKASVGGYAPEGTLIVKDIQSTFNGNILEQLIVTIDMKSLHQENERLTKHLKDKDFFHVKKYPMATFTLTEAFSPDSSEYLIGIMTIKNKKQTEKIRVQASFQKNGTLSLSFDHTMNRLDYGITYNSLSIFKSLKENAIADSFTLKGNLFVNP